MYTPMLSLWFLCFALFEFALAGLLHSPQHHKLAYHNIRLSTNVTRTKNATTIARKTETSGPRASLLFAGIGANIDAQQGQLDAIQSLIALQTTLQPSNLTNASSTAKNSTISHRMRFNNGTTDATPYFLAAKQTLLAFTRASAQIRAANLFLANINPQVERGLAQLETEQVREVMLVGRLNGNQQADAATLQQLKGSVQQAMQKNRGLQEIASGAPIPPSLMESKSSNRTISRLT